MLDAYLITQYYVEIPANIIYDGNGNYFAGLVKGDYTFTTSPNHDANLDEAVKIIMNDGTYQYTAYIGDASYDIYRIKNGHVVLENGVFVNRLKNDDTDYLINANTVDLVTDGAILQKAGFLHSRPFQDDSIKSRMTSEIDGIRSNMAKSYTDLDNGMQKYNDALQNAANSKWVKFSVDAYLAYATGGLSSVIKLGGDMTTTFIVNKTKDKVLEGKRQMSVRTRSGKKTSIALPERFGSA